MISLIRFVDIERFNRKVKMRSDQEVKDISRSLIKAFVRNKNEGVSLRSTSSYLYSSEFTFKKPKQFNAVDPEFCLYDINKLSNFLEKFNLLARKIHDDELKVMLRQINNFLDKLAGNPTIKSGCIYKRKPQLQSDAYDIDIKFGRFDSIIVELDRKVTTEFTHKLNTFKLIEVEFLLTVT